MADALFPSTMWSEVLALQRQDPDGHRQRMERLIERYWSPVYWVLRRDRGLPEEDARDLTQEFFIQILEGQVISTVDPSKGSFRQYLRLALRHFLMDEWRKKQTVKRGGGKKMLSLDFDHAGVEPPDLGPDPEKALDKAWAHRLLDESLRDLEAQGQEKAIEVFRAYELPPGSEKPTYSELATRFGLSVTEVQNALKSCRKKLYDILLKKIGTYVRDEDELYAELHELFGR